MFRKHVCIKSYFWFFSVHMLLSIFCTVNEAYSKDTVSVKQIDSIKQHENGVSLHGISNTGEKVYFIIHPLTDSMLRIRASVDNNFEMTLPEKDGFLKADWPNINFKASDQKEQYVIGTKKLKVILSKSPFQISFYQDDRLLTQSAMDKGVSIAKDESVLSMLSPDDERFYGFCDQGTGWRADYPPDRAPLDHRGTFLNMAGLSSHRVYYSPFFMSSRGYGFFMNTLVRSDWDMAKLDKDRYTINVNERKLDFYIIAGPSFKDILNQYTDLVGKPPLPPKWIMGGRVNARLYDTKDSSLTSPPKDYLYDKTWHSQRQIIDKAETIRETHLPVEHMHIDAAWETEYGTFEWVPEIPDPEKMIDRLHSINFKVSLWQRPTVPAHDYPNYNMAVENGYLVMGPDGKPFVAPNYRGPSAMWDFTNPRARDWWEQKVRKLVELGMDSIKLDSASSGFVEAFPEALEMQFYNGMTGKQLDNYYGPMHIKIIWDTIKEALNGKRAVLIIKHSAYFAGSRYPYIGLGDRKDATKQCKIRYALNIGLSGVSFWHGAGFGAFGISGMDKAFNLKMAPYTYTYWREANETGLPILRAMLLEYPDDPVAALVDTQYLFGENILVAPVLHEDDKWRKLYIPKGDWLDYWNNQRYQGPRWLYVPVRKDKEPMLIQSGAIIPTGPAVEYTDQKPLNPLTLDIYPDGQTGFTMYEDDEKTYAYENGEFTRTTFLCRENDNDVTVEIKPVKGKFDGMLKQRDYLLRIHNTVKPKYVKLKNQMLDFYEDPEKLQEAHCGWCYTGWGLNRTIHIKLPSTKTREGLKIHCENAKVVRYYIY